MATTKTKDLEEEFIPYVPGGSGTSVPSPAATDDDFQPYVPQDVDTDRRPLPNSTFGLAAEATNPIPKESWWDKAKAFAKKDKTNYGTEFIKGQLKGVASTALGVGQALEKGAGKIADAAEGAYNATIGKATGRNAIGGAGDVLRVAADDVGAFRRSDMVVPQGGGQKLGYGVEQVGELFMPIGIESAAAKGAAKIAEAAPGIAKVAKPALTVAREAADLGAKTIARTGGDTEEAARQALLAGATAGVGEILTPVVAKAFPAASKALEKINFRLTPTQKRELGTKIDDAAKVVIDNGITGSPQKRLQKVAGLVEDTEDAFQSWLKKEARGVKVSRQKLIDEAENLKKVFQDDRDVGAIESQIDGFVNLLKTKYDDVIPVEKVNNLKRSTFKTAYNNAGSKVRDDVEHGLGTVLKNAIEEETAGLKINGKPIGDFNREYGGLITARKLLDVASGRKEIGLIGSLIAMSVGGSVGDAIGGNVGAAVGSGIGTTVAGGLAGTAMRSGLAQVLDGASKFTPSDVAQIVNRVRGANAKKQP